jgi:hypothetical protein
MIVERGRTVPDGEGPSFLPETVADGLTALAIATAENFRHGYLLGGPLDSVRAMRDAASAAKLPTGRTRRISRNLFETVAQQPAQVDGFLGPASATATRAIGEAIRRGLLHPPVSIMTVTRTINRRHMRHRSSIGGRPGGRQDQGVVVGQIAASGGGSFSFASHLPTQERNDVPAALLAYHETGTEVELNPLTTRMEIQNGVWLDLRETMGVTLPVVNRGERRFAPIEEQVGCATSNHVWYPAEHPGWAEDVKRTFSASAVVLGEVSQEWLEGKSYRSELGVRPIHSPRRFMEDVDLRLRMLEVRSIDPGEPSGERPEGAEEILTLGGTLVGQDGSEYIPIVVLPTQHTTATVYVMPAERAAAVTTAGWRSVLTALRALHGPAWVPTSEDQGRALSLPFERGATVTSSNPDMAANYDSLRFFAHALESRPHWRLGEANEGGR